MKKPPIGVLLLHGLSSHITCIDPVVPRLKKYNIPYRAPYLRGHGTKPEDLVGVTWQDWYADAEKAFKELLNEADKVVIVALSMGVNPGLDVALAYQERVAGIVSISACLRLKAAPTWVIPLMGRVQKKVVFKDDPLAYIDQEMARTNQNYKWLPSSAVMELGKYMRRMNNPRLISQIKVPILVIATTNDRTVIWQRSQWLYDTVSSTDKRLKLFHRSGHEMLRDGEREQVLDEIEKFVAELNDKAAKELGQTQTA